MHSCSYSKTNAFLFIQVQTSIISLLIDLTNTCRYATSKIPTCHRSFKYTVFALVLVLVLVIIMLFHQRTPYVITVESPSKQNLLPLQPATILLTTQSNGDELDACLPDLLTLNPLDFIIISHRTIDWERERNKSNFEMA